MKWNTILKSCKKPFIVLLFSTLFITTTSLSIPDNEVSGKIKSRFKSVMMDRTTLEFYNKKADFGHFVFQQKLVDKKGRYHIYSLIAYAYDKAGNLYHPHPISLQDAPVQAEKDITDRIEMTALSSYFLTKDNLEKIVMQETSYSFVYINPIAESNSNSYNGYVTYYIHPVVRGQMLASHVALTLAGENYLKPSPPAF